MIARPLEGGCSCADEIGAVTDDVCAAFEVADVIILAIPLPMGAYKTAWMMECDGENE